MLHNVDIGKYVCFVAVHKSVVKRHNMQLRIFCMTNYVASGNLVIVHSPAAMITPDVGEQL